MGLNHLPSGRFATNGACLGAGIVTTKTLRRRLFSLAARLTRSARRWRLRLPARWPWAIEFSTALARLRAIPLLA